MKMTEYTRMCEYLNISDYDSFNAPIEHVPKNVMIPRVIPCGVDGENDKIIGKYAKKHETRHILHRRVMADLLKEDPKVFEFFKGDQNKNKTTYFLSKIASKIISRKYKKDFGKLEEIVSNTKTENDVVENAEILSGYMLMSYFGKDAGVMENFANEGSNKAVGSLCTGMTAYVITSAGICLNNLIEGLRYATPNTASSVAIVAGGIAALIFGGLAASDSANLAINSLSDYFSEKKLDKFTPRERKYLVALPSKEDPEKRLAEMRRFGLNVDGDDRDG